MKNSFDVEYIECPQCRKQMMKCLGERAEILFCSLCDRSYFLSDLKNAGQGGTMNKIVVNLSGWADSIAGDAKIKFALQLAFYNTLHDCDWEFDLSVESVGNTSMVSKPWDIGVVARRVISRGFDEPRKERITYEVVSIGFVVDQLTFNEIYFKAVEALKTRKF